MQQSKTKKSKLESSRLQKTSDHKSKGKALNRGKSGVIRIIGGSLRGRKLRFSTANGLRPTLDRVRETLFNWVAPYVANSQCLDLFAGSGAIGFEAYSRGAKKVYLIEKNAKVVNDLRTNCEKLAIDDVKIINLDAIRFLKTNQDKFDLIFLDPPFGQGLLAEIMTQLESHLAEDGLVYIEQESSDDEFILDLQWKRVKYKKTGSFSYALYRFNA